MSKKLFVIKIGTSSLTRPGGDIDREKIQDTARQISDIRDGGDNVAVVTSGSIAAGFRALGYSSRPSSVTAKQASAAVGQGLLMEEYTRFFSERGYVTAQVLLTRGDFTDKRRYKNAFSALEILLSRGAIPIINENDTVAIDELKLGDNDTLSSQVAAMLHADLLVLLTDIDGLYTADPSKDPSARHIDRVESVTGEIEKLAGGAGSANGTGGMITKIRGARLATAAGVPVFICSSKTPDNILKACRGEAVGTLFEQSGNLKTRLQWMAFYAPSKGNIYIDDGAAKALTEKGSSLLTAGVTAVEGDFSEGDVVVILTSESHRIVGRGIADLSRDEINADRELGKERGEVAVHKDNLVLGDF